MSRFEELTEEQQGILLTNIVHGKLTRAESVFVMMCVNFAVESGELSRRLGTHGDAIIRSACEEKPPGGKK